MVQMMRVHAPEKNCCKSRQPESGRFASRGFAFRAEDKETAGEHKPFPLDFDMTRLPLYPPVQAKLAGGSAGDRQENEDAASSQGAGEKAPADGQAQPKAERQEPNRTGMPDRLKAGIEALSGLDMSDVRVHANSPKPARLNALAYTQGNQIYMGPGQERHLPHEAWHAVQQKQGRVRATREIKCQGFDTNPRREHVLAVGYREKSTDLYCAINDDQSLEQEANVMGTKAFQITPNDQLTTNSTSRKATSLQRKKRAPISFPLPEVRLDFPSPISIPTSNQPIQREGGPFFPEEVVKLWRPEFTRRNPPQQAHDPMFDRPIPIFDINRSRLEDLSGGVSRGQLPSPIDLSNLDLGEPLPPHSMNDLMLEIMRAQRLKEIVAWDKEMSEYKQELKEILENTYSYSQVYATISDLYSKMGQNPNKDKKLFEEFKSRKDMLFSDWVKGEKVVGELIQGEKYNRIYQTRDSKETKSAIRQTREYFATLSAGYETLRNDLKPYAYWKKESSSPQSRNQIVSINITSKTSPEDVNRQLPVELANGLAIASHIINHPQEGLTRFSHNGGKIYHASNRSSVSNQAGTAFWTYERPIVSIIAIGQHTGTDSKTYKILWKADKVMLPSEVKL